MIRDPDGHCYFREWNGGIMAGGFEPPHHGGKPVFHNGIPHKFEFQLLQEDWDQFRMYSVIFFQWSSCGIDK